MKKYSIIYADPPSNTEIMKGKAKDHFVHLYHGQGQSMNYVKEFAQELIRLADYQIKNNTMHNLSIGMLIEEKENKIYTKNSCVCTAACGAGLGHNKK